MLYLPMTFDVDVSGMLAVAEQLYNALNDAFLVIVGIVLALFLITLVVQAITKAVASKNMWG